MSDIFISYRRIGGGAQAILMYERLSAAGYDVFLDIHSLGSGIVDDALPAEIEHCTDFLLVLSPNALESCEDPRDYVRREIEAALKYKKNIIPIFMKGFEKPENLPQWLDNILNHNGVDMTVLENMDASIERLKTKRLHSKPSIRRKLKKSRHPLRYPREKSAPEAEEPEEDGTVCPICKSTHLTKNDRMVNLIRFSNGCNELLNVMGELLWDVTLIFGLLFILYRTTQTRALTEQILSAIPVVKNVLQEADPGKELLKSSISHFFCIVPFLLVNWAVTEMRTFYYAKSIERNVYKVEYSCTDCGNQFTLVHDAQTLIARINALPREKSDIAYPIALIGVIGFCLCLPPLRIFLILCAALIILAVIATLSVTTYRIKKGKASKQELETFLYGFIGLVFNLPDVTPEASGEKADDTNPANDDSP